MADEDSKHIVNVRIMRGVDLNVNARLVDPGTYLSTTNLYARLKGILELRPGSLLISNVISAYVAPVLPATLSAIHNPVEPMLTTGWKKNLNPPPYPEGGARAYYNAANTIQAKIPEYLQNPVQVMGGVSLASNWKGAVAPHSLSYTIVPTTAPGHVWQVSTAGTSGGTQPSWPAKPAPGDTIADGGVIWTFKGYNLGASNIVEALERLNLPHAGKAFWVGAMSNPIADFLFYIDPTTNNMVPIPSNGLEGAISGHNCIWQIQRARVASTVEADNDRVTVNMIAVNGVDRPFVLTVNVTAQTTGGDTLNASQPFTVTQPVFSATHAPNRALTAPKCFCVYGNQVAWGGFCMSEQNGDGDIQHFENFLCFSDPTSANGSSTLTPITTLADDGSTGILTIQIGETPDEAVLALSGSPAITDGFGMQGQLIAWTGYKTVIYNGPLPSSGNAIPPGFGLAATGETGTWSPKSVQRTSYGTVFLGSDGLVYLVALDNRIVVIGRALEPILGNQTQIFYSRVCSYYHKGFYHLFFPGTANSNTNTQEWVADLRSLQLGNPQDQGVEWFGPFTGRSVNCVKVARSPQDPFIIYAGLSHLPAVIKLEDTTTYSDPDMSNLTGPKIIYQWGALTGDLDLGDAHMDKIVSAFSIGIMTLQPVSVIGTIAAMSDVEGQALGFTATKTVTPNAPVLGAMTLGVNANLSSFNNFSLPTWQPSSTIRGRAFNVSFLASPTVEAFARLSDFEFRLRAIERRSTDLV